MVPRITRANDGAHMFGLAPVELEGMPIELVDACLDFCEADPSTYDAATVAAARGAADALEDAAFPQGFTYNPANIESMAVHCTITATRDRAETWEANRAKEQDRREREADYVALRYIDALRRLADAAAYLEAHDAPELPPTWKRAPGSMSAEDADGMMAEAARYGAAAKGLSAKAKREATAYADALAAMWDSKRAAGE